MVESHSIAVDHKDIIHDVKYDLYGRRMATCSSDQTVKIWHKNEYGKWTQTCSWKAHSGPIWRLDWCHPEFGQVIATCSFDRNVCIWEEVSSGEPSGGKSGPASHWLRRTMLVDSRANTSNTCANNSAIRALEFSPKSLGLQLAAVSGDGTTFIYEALDIMKLSQWSLMDALSCNMPLCCISWNRSTFRARPIFAVGSDKHSDSSTSRVLIYAYDGNPPKWTMVESIQKITDPVTDVAFAPNAGRSFHILAVASKDLYIAHITSCVDAVGHCHLDVHTTKITDHNCKVWRVCWNRLATSLVSTGDDGCVRVWSMNYHKTWRCTAVLKADGMPHELSPTPPPSFSPTAAAAAKLSWRNQTAAQK